jgi:anaerobic selenocysteine-containing dehydrogenase
VHTSRGVLEPASDQLLSEIAIICGIARATLGERTTVDWERLANDYDCIRDHIEHVVPGFTQYNARVRQPGGFYLPNAPHDGKFNTPTRRAKFVVHAIPERTLASDQLLLTTIRSHDQFNTTIYAENDRYRGITHGRRVLLMNERDIAARSLQPEQWVDIASHFEGETRIAPRFKVVPYDIPEGCAASYFPETNILVPLRAVAEKSNQPASKSVVITVAPSAVRFADAADSEVPVPVSRETRRPSLRPTGHRGPRVTPRRS